MKDFKFCVWLVPEENSEWHKYVDGFIPHMTVRSGIETEKDALKLFKLVVAGFILSSKCRLKMVDGLRSTSSEGFSALEFSVIRDGDGGGDGGDSDEKALWWPDGAHVSVAYKYDEVFGEKERNEYEKKIVVRSALIGEVRVMKCTGHFRDWVMVANWRF